MKAALVAIAACTPAPAPAIANRAPVSARIAYDQTCNRPCIGYSPSTDTWLCQHRESKGASSTCTIELLRADHVLSEAVVYGARASELTVPFELAMRLAPADLAPPTKTLELSPDIDLALPHSRHRLRWEPRSSHSSRIVAVCYSPLASRAPAIVYNSASMCDVHERYTVEVSGDHLALVVDQRWTCTEAAGAERHAHPIDLVELCGADTR